jgi:hypothetical protein
MALLTFWLDVPTTASRLASMFIHQADSRIFDD